MKDELINFNSGKIKKIYPKIRKFAKNNLIILMILIPIMFSIFFRIEPYNLSMMDEFAEESIENTLKEQIRNQIHTQYPDMNSEDLENIVDQNYQEFISSNKQELDNQKDKISKKLKDYYKDDNGSSYLLAIDPYFYLKQAENILENGHIGDTLVDGKPFSTQMLAPNGKHVDSSLHPYLIVLVHKFSKIFGGTSLMNSAFLLPLILICLSIIPCFFIIKRFVGNIGAIFGSIILAIHPALLARTPAGFSDTDAYNIFFPLMVVWLIIESFRAKDLKNKLLLSATSGLFIGLYSFTWAGWWNTFDFILAGLLTYFIILLFKFRKNIYKNKLSRNFLYNSFTFIFSSSIFITIFTNFQTLLTSITSPINTIFIKEIAKSSLWPNVYTTVAELNEVAFAGILTNLGGLIFFLMSFIGISIIIFNSKYKLSKLKYSIIFLFWFMGTFYASTKGIRFTLLMVPVFSIGIGIFVGKIYDYLKKLIKKQLDIDKRLITIMLILGLVFLLLPLINDANQIQKQGRPSFNDAWYNSLTNIRENSNEDSIITSWWDFGHWFKYYSNRAVTFDGGSQNRPQAHWVGKLLLTNNEDESMGILRMLNCGGNNAYDLILQKTQSEIDSINILNEILLKSKEEAKTILELRDLPVADILKKTHCSPRDNFLITSQDMVNKAGVWGHFGAWDFEKSLMYNKFNNNLDFNLESLGYSEQELKEIENLILTSSDEDLNSWIAPYPSYSGNFGDCINQEEFILCNNGVVIDTLNKISKIQTNDGIIDIGIYRDTINFYESGQDTELAIAYFEETNKSLIMASELIGSLFTELYYYESKNLKNFELFDKQIGVDGFKIYTWKIKW